MTISASLDAFEHLRLSTTPIDEAVPNATGVSLLIGVNDGPSCLVAVTPIKNAWPISEGAAPVKMSSPVVLHETLSVCGPLGHRHSLSCPLVVPSVKAVSSESYLRRLDAA